MSRLTVDITSAMKIYNIINFLLMKQFLYLLFYYFILYIFRGPLKYIHKIYIITFCFFFCVFSSHIFCKILIAYVRTGSYLFKMLENKKGILDFVYSSRTLQTKLLPWWITFEYVSMVYYVVPYLVATSWKYSPYSGIFVFYTIYMYIAIS